MKKTIRIFYSLLAIFIILMSYIVIPFFLSIRQALFPFMAVLAVIFFLLGLALVFFAWKLKIKGSLKKFLILTGVSASGFFVFAILHNFFYGFGIIAKDIIIIKYIMEALSVASFIIAVFVCPILFLIGAIGSIHLLIKKKKK